MPAPSTQMKAPGRTAAGQTVLVITDAIVFSGPSGEFGFAPGQTWIFDSDRDIPAGLSSVSEAYRGGALPHDVLHFDPAQYARVMRPRPEPTPERWLTEADIRQRFRWSPKQWHLALSHAGFPKSSGLRMLKGAEPGSAGVEIWRDTSVDQWADAVRQLMGG